jgi:hypothetical protein
MLVTTFSPKKIKIKIKTEEFFFWQFVFEWISVVFYNDFSLKKD